MGGEWLTGDLLGFDLETTGINPFEDRPVSFALVSYRNGERVSVTHRLRQPGIAIPPEAMAIHHITDEMVRAEGMPLDEAVAFLCEAALSCLGRGGRRSSGWCCGSTSR